MNDSELAAKLDGLNVPAGNGATLVVVSFMDGDVSFKCQRVYWPASAMLALSRAVCEAAGLRVVEDPPCVHSYWFSCKCGKHVCNKCGKEYTPEPKVPSQANDGEAEKGGGA